MTANSKRVAIIILNFNRHPDLVTCLKSVYQLDYEPFEVIVVDNGSTDGSPEEAQRLFPQTQIIRNNINLGIPLAHNVGFQYALQKMDPHYVLFLDNDTTVDRKFLHHLVDALEKNKKAGIACGKAYAEHPSKTLMCAGVSVNLRRAKIVKRGFGETDKGQYDKKSTIDAAGSFGLFARAEVISKLGGFDENFHPYGWPDVDLCLRARKQGTKTLYVPKALVYHRGSTLNRKPLSAYEKSKVKNFFKLLTRHTTSCQKISCALYIPYRAAAVAGKMLTEGNLGAIRGQVRGFVSGMIPEDFKHTKSHSRISYLVHHH